ncbi:hypothetical protein ACFPOB_31020 [Bosea eneae]|uniref:Uncharacterized protein n=1 Tax=Bosea eneae TaxID=151454 RepID=A0ABW0J2D9_9HYPH
MRFLSALALVAVAVPAMAAEPSPLPDGVAMLIQYFAAMVATVVVGWIALAANRFLGISLEGRHREALHSGLTTGASLILSMVAELIAQGRKPEDARRVALQTGLEYVRRSVPDAIAALHADDEMLRTMLRAKQVQIGGVPVTRPVGVRG